MEILVFKSPRTIDILEIEYNALGFVVPVYRNQKGAPKFQGHVL